MNKIDLDDSKTLRDIDKANMLAALDGFSGQCREAAEIGRAAGEKFAIDVTRLNKIVVLGMGGSGISGDILKVLLAGSAPIPVIVNKNYTLPEYVDNKSLVIAVSYSGNTEETLEATRAAHARGAALLALSSGGKLAELAAQQGLFRVAIPGGLQPRAALGYLSLPLLTMLHGIGLAKEFSDDIKELVTMLDKKEREWGVDSPISNNISKQLALDLYEKVPIVFGAAGLSGVAALRWKCQFNENGKTPCFWNQLPELDHNEIMGWERHNNFSRTFHLITLRDNREHARITRRFTVTGDLIKDSFIGRSEFSAEGGSELTRLFSLAHLSDFASAYLALLKGIDPTPVDRIELLKSKLAGMK